MRFSLCKKQNMTDINEIIDKRNQLIEDVIYSNLKEVDLNDVIVTHRDMPPISETTISYKGTKVGRKIITNFHDLTVRYE